MRRHILHTKNKTISKEDLNNLVKSLLHWASDSCDGIWQIPDPAPVEEKWTNSQLRYYWGMIDELVRVEGHNIKSGYHSQFMIDLGFCEETIVSIANNDTGEIVDHLNYLPWSLREKVGKKNISILIEYVISYSFNAGIHMPDIEEWKSGKRAYRMEGQ